MQKISDMWFAAFLFRKGKTVSKVTREGTKGTWTFDISEIEYQALRFEFAKSEETEIKYTIEKLKDMLF